MLNLHLSKINKEIEARINRIDELVNKKDDYDRRIGYVTVNVKCYKWPDWQDVEDAIKPLNLKDEQKQLVLEEFNDNRLQGIREHILECGYYDFKEEFDWKQYRDGRRKESKLAQALYTIRAEASNMYLLGRCGGNLSLVPWSDVALDYRSNNAVNLWDDFDRWKEEIDNNAFNEILSGHIDSWREKKQLIRELDADIEQMEEYFEALDYVIEYVEHLRDGLDGSIEEQLKREIEDFLEDGITANATISIDGDDVLTSMGVRVPKSAALEALKYVDKCIRSADGNSVDIHLSIGKWIVEKCYLSNDAWIVKAGCHRIPLDQIKRTFEHEFQYELF